MKAEISFIIPCRNGEEYIIENVIDIICTCQENNIPYKIIIVDDGSIDDTWMRLTTELSKDVSVYKKCISQGKGSALKSGWKLAKSPYIAFVDADLQIRPTEITTFLKIMELYDADAVVGNKRHDYSIIDYSLIRKVVSVGYMMLVRSLFGIRLRDTQCGMKLFKKECLDEVMPKILVKRFAYDIELITALKENGYRIADAPVYQTKPVGKGSVSLKTIFETAKDTLAVYYRKRIGYYKIKSG